MRWRDGDRAGNIEDRRGLGPVGTVGGLGLGGAVLVLIGVLVFGADPGEMLGLVGSGAGGEARVEGVRGSPSDEAAAFVDVIETSTTEVWRRQFARAGERYEPTAAVVLYDEMTPTGCGTGQAAMGPFYCPFDRKIYLDLTFWNELESRFGAGGDFARAYVIAHEIGHHVQNLTGAMDAARRLGAKGADSGGVRLELQADCYAGVWASRVEKATLGKVTMDKGDIEEGMAAASAVGDDTLQRRAGGRVVPDAFTHGTAEQRGRWFATGYTTGDPAKCDTLKAETL